MASVSLSSTIFNPEPTPEERKRIEELKKKEELKKQLTNHLNNLVDGAKVISQTAAPYMIDIGAKFLKSNPHGAPFGTAIEFGKPVAVVSANASLEQSALSSKLHLVPKIAECSVSLFSS
jgi:hypothetical protein